ncbi:MAG: FAD-dependent oxidoreductase, partial [Acidobacteria bacterium]|nr:FAD-dependent oxidoreductase [Acidobacteriota bacterium]
MPEKLGVYICSGCEIGQSIDTEQLAKVAKSEYKVPVCQVHPALCGAEAVAAIRGELAGGAIDGVVIAACSQRVKTEAFDFGPKVVAERVNIREHVVWCQKPNDEDTQTMAEDYLRMGIAKAKKMEPPEPLAEAISKKVMVVGGGVTGVTAALEAAAADYEVVLVEKEAQLGGFAATLKKRFSGEPPYDELVSDGLANKIQAATYNPKIQVFTSAKILKTAGQPGMFDVTIQTDAGASEVRVGSIIMATGWKPYDASKLGHLGYGLSPDVITNVELERMTAAGPIRRPSDGGTVTSALFVQCAGSRDSEHLPYCSSVCCMASLKHAAYLREQNPEVQVYIIYKDMRTPGQYEKFYRTAQNDPLNFLTKGEVAGVAKTAEGRLAVTVRDTLLGGEITLHVDLVVLATGMVANSADGEAIRALEDAKIKAEKGESEAQRAEALVKIEQLKAHEGTEILNLTYRQTSFW